jgi:hypothetical protein
MNKREKILAASAGLVAVVFVTYLAINRVFLIPAADCENQAKDLQEKIRLANAQKGKEDTYKTHLKELAGDSFGTDELKVIEQVRTVVTDVLTVSGLSAQNLSLKPLTGSRVPGVYKEVGWAVRARGKLPQVISFLYLMTKEAHLHRVDNVVLTPVTGGEVELQAKYATLLLEAPKGEKLVTDEEPDLPDASLLESPDRQQYQMIASRDLFRPYMQAKAKPPETPPQPREQPPSPPPRGNEGRYRVVGLPTFSGQAEVAIKDFGNNKTTFYKPGDDLAGGKVVMVDYRPMPLPKKPEILSESRVVLQVGSEYYAVELGQSLTEKRALTGDDVPPGLPKLESPPPAEAPPTAPGSTQQ